MRIKVLNSNYGFLTGDRSMHRWAEEFMNTYTEGAISYEDAKSYDGDMIVCLNGRPDLFENCPPKEFKGVKVVHLMDHVFRVKETLSVLKENNVTHLMCYNRHDLYDPFFKHFYSDYIGKVIPVPFGYNDLRFKNNTPFEQRKNKVVSLGSVNPVSDPLCLSDIQEYADFNKGEKFTHKWRRMLVENIGDLKDIMDSRLPVFPETKDFGYDIAQEYNGYKMFTTCASIMNYPSVKTFEGMACGSVFVCEDLPCYRDIGFIHGQNCVMHEKGNIEDFKWEVTQMENNPQWLELISKNGQKFVEKNFNPKKIAENLYHDLCKLCT